MPVKNRRTDSCVNVKRLPRMMTVSIKVSVHVDHKRNMGRQVISRKNLVEPILKKLTRESSIAGTRPEASNWRLYHGPARSGVLSKSTKLMKCRHRRRCAHYVAHIVEY